MLKQKQTYSVEFKEQALLKILHRENRTVQSVAEDFKLVVASTDKIYAAFFSW